MSSRKENFQNFDDIYNSDQSLILTTRFGSISTKLIHSDVFPTLTESIKLVATSFKQNIEKLTCCAQ
jgi:hypothetical protein